MKLSEQWLREWVNPPVSLSEIAKQLTMAGIEVEAIEPVAGDFSKVVIAQIIDAKPHENAEKLRVCTVDIGESEPLQIVCGAANARAGLKVAAAVVGAVLPNGLTIKQAKLRGVVSQGMLCSASELGLTETSEGILELAHDAPIGQDIRKWLLLDDTTIELSVTPNRGDCLSIAGIAREVAVLHQQDITQPTFQVAPITMSEAVFPVTILAPQACPHYLGRVIKQVDITAKTPLWMQERLRRSGIKCISPVVDVTNYVLLELGQPMHAFDLAQLDGQIAVRQAQPGELLTLLDGQTVELTEQTLVIADNRRPLAIAGVMGGLDSAVTANTTDIFLESAYFDPLTIAGRARQYGLQTDSAYRFERGVDPTLQRCAMERATELLLAIVGGVVGPIIEIRHELYLPVQKVIPLRRLRIEQLLGFPITDQEVAGILQRLGMALVPDTQGWQVKAPIHRFDMAIEADLIEELVRIKGYDSVPLHYPLTRNQLQLGSEKILKLRRIRSLLTDRGYREAITYSFVDTDLQQWITPHQQAMTLVNPMSSEMAQMRMSLWPGLIHTLLYNQNRQQTRVRLYETGLCFNQQGTDIRQEMRLGGIVSGTVYPEQWGVNLKPTDFFDVKSDLEALFQLSLAGANYCFTAEEHPALHPGQSAKISRDGRAIGYLGKLHPALEQRLELAENVYLFELDLSEIVMANIPQYQPLSRFPAIRRDLAILVEDKVSAQAIQQCIVEAAGVLLRHIWVFDVYQGKGIQEGYKSLAIAITLQHETRTLIDQEVADLIKTIMIRLEQQFNAILRD